MTVKCIGMLDFLYMIPQKTKSSLTMQTNPAFLSLDGVNLAEMSGITMMNLEDNKTV